MQDVYTIVDSFDGGRSKVELAEHLISVTPEYKTIRHELHITPRGQKTIILNDEEFLRMGKAAIAALERAKERKDRFEAEDEVLA